MEKNSGKTAKENKSDIPVANSSKEIRVEDDEIDLLELIGIMWVHKWWIIGITGFAAVVAILYTIFSSSAFSANWKPVEKYTSTAVVLVNEASGVGILGHVHRSGRRLLDGDGGFRRRRKPTAGAQRERFCGQP